MAFRFASTIFHTHYTVPVVHCFRARSAIPAGTSESKSISQSRTASGSSIYIRIFEFRIFELNHNTGGRAVVRPTHCDPTLWWCACKMWGNPIKICMYLFTEKVKITRFRELAIPMGVPARGPAGRRPLIVIETLSLTAHVSLWINMTPDAPGHMQGHSTW